MFATPRRPERLLFPFLLACRKQHQFAYNYKFVFYVSFKLFQIYHSIKKFWLLSFSSQFDCPADCQVTMSQKRQIATFDSSMKNNYDYDLI